MRTIPNSIKTTFLVLTAVSFTAAFARAGTYSAANLQSDIPGLAAHVDPNLINPWGMAVPSATGPIWVSDNGTGVSTLYNQADGTARPLVVTIPTSARNKGGGNPKFTARPIHLRQRRRFHLWLESYTGRYACNYRG